jgi:hypothetical protein
MEGLTPMPTYYPSAAEAPTLGLSYGSGILGAVVLNTNPDGTVNMLFPSRVSGTWSETNCVMAQQAWLNAGSPPTAGHYTQP